jgi:hypothetical protein
MSLSITTRSGWMCCPNPMTNYNAKDARNLDLWMLRNGGAKWTELAARFGVSVERAKQIHAKEDRQSRTEIRRIAYFLNRSLSGQRSHLPIGARRRNRLHAVDDPRKVVDGES